MSGFRKWGVQRAGLAAGSLWQNMVPIFAVLISMLYGIFPTIQQIVGGAIVLCGVLYMQWRRVRRRARGCLRRPA